MKIGGESSITNPILGMFALISYVLFFLVVCPIGITLILYRLFGSPQMLDVKEPYPLVLQSVDLADAPMTVATNVLSLNEP
jgi:hypothetical protein